MPSPPSLKGYPKDEFFPAQAAKETLRRLHPLPLACSHHAQPPPITEGLRPT